MTFIGLQTFYQHNKRVNNCVYVQIKKRQEEAGHRVALSNRIGGHPAEHPGVPSTLGKRTHEFGKSWPPTCIIYYILAWVADCVPLPALSIQPKHSWQVIKENFRFTDRFYCCIAKLTQFDLQKHSQTSQSVPTIEKAFSV